MTCAKTLAMIANLGLTPDEVADIIESYMDELEAAEPYATNPIRAAHETAEAIRYLEAE